MNQQSCMSSLKHKICRIQYKVIFLMRWLLFVHHVVALKQLFYRTPVFSVLSICVYHNLVNIGVTKKVWLKIYHAKQLLYKPTVILTFYVARLSCTTVEKQMSNLNIWFLWHTTVASQTHQKFKTLNFTKL